MFRFRAAALSVVVGVVSLVGCGGQGDGIETGAAPDDGCAEAEIPYNGEDDDCDAATPDDDVDGDGFRWGDDCDDDDSATWPGAADQAGDGVDSDCDGTDGVDADGDGYADLAYGGDDCDDADPLVSPAAEEVCDGVDNDCDGAADDDDPDGVDEPLSWYADGDGDGYGAGDAVAEGCAGPDGAAATADDCDDSDSATWPGAEEVCGDGAVNDCDDATGEAAAAACGLTGSLGGAARLDGEAERDGAGGALAAGLLGEPVLAVGAPSRGDRGAVYVVEGPWASGSLGAAAAVLSGESDGDGAGTALALLSGDDSALLVGAPFRGTNAGAAYLVSGPVTGALDLSTADARLIGEDTGDNAGYAVSGAGDADGDGRADVLVGAVYADAGAIYAGSAYLSYGPVTSGPLAGAEVTLHGAANGDRAGAAVRVGDLDGDGLAEVVVGADRSGDADRGAVYVVSGAEGAFDLADADGVWVGDEDGDEAGAAVGGGGDTDGDGLADLVVGAPARAGGDGGAWVLLGPAVGSHALSAAAAVVTGGSGREAGAAVAMDGDVDADGLADVLVGVPGADAGGVRLFYGPVEGAVSTADAGVVLDGEADRDSAGGSVALFDLDETGASWLIVGAEAFDGAATNAGAAYLVPAPAGL